MKDQAVRLQALLCILALALLTAGTAYLALDLLKETGAYLNESRNPVMIQGGAARF